MRRKAVHFSMRFVRLASAAVGVTAAATMAGAVPATAATSVFYSSSVAGGSGQLNDPKAGPCYTVATGSLSARNNTSMVAHLYTDPFCSTLRIRLDPGNEVGTVFGSVRFSAE
ncbi:hypothetical protein [Actinomadura rubrisoli]|uniref:Uncharacterized protein n=1 Tax=Actinomadura rubrisoli TaxID=2530368 RepID=A0A4R5C7E2_9ACTN|nr:hypothetical protein [Actinomadura rubrisoli]TDD94639.1 hypothetical protein E1298_06555 [Actinomadura rubrisoli]